MHVTNTTRRKILQRNRLQYIDIILPPRPLQSLLHINTSKQRLSGRKPARVEAPAAATAAAVGAAAGPGSSRVAAPADRSTASALLDTGGGTARLLARAGRCTVNSPAEAEAESIRSEPLRRPRGRATQARQSADVYLSLYLYRVHTTKYCKKIQKTEKEQNTMVRHSRKSTRDQGPTNRPTYQR